MPDRAAYIGDRVIVVAIRRELDGPASRIAAMRSNYGSGGPCTGMWMKVTSRSQYRQEFPPIGSGHAIFAPARTAHRRWRSASPAQSRRPDADHRQVRRARDL